ncbi:MAG TPA: TMEM14 family protein [Acidobacteriota bacterium]|jgi:uncharacterized membrane protein (UPF0136 family)
MTWTATLVFAVLMLVGGIIGYAKARSVPSLVSGLVGGAVLGYAGFLIRAQQPSGILIAAVATGVLAVVFVMRLLRTKKFMPAGMLLLLSLLELFILFSASWWKSK